MTLVTSEKQGLETEDLLRSFHSSIRDLRTVIEGLKQQAFDGEEIEFAAAAKILVPAESLIRNCRKLEMTLAEQTNRDLGIAQGGYAIDLDRARLDIGRRLARLRAACTAGSVSE